MFRLNYTVVGVLVVLLHTSRGTQYDTSEFENCTGLIEYIADGRCHRINNIESCSYDGGDCCSCSCVDGLQYECGSDGFSCRDESCIDPAIIDQFPDCTGYLLELGNGECNEYNNVPECGYDGGDCCVCTCVGSASCTFDFNCIDPGAGDEMHECQMSPPPTLPCSADVSQNWVIEDAAQARALVKAINCSGGFFQVKWRGDISMDETIFVVDGTALNITGSGPGSVIIGSSEKRLITVVNASLHLKDISIKFGSALVGGAIASSASSLNFIQTSFVGNKADAIGGALYVVNGSSVLFDGNITTFSKNVAVGSGGAVYVGDSSMVSWNGENASFADNISQLDGGAVTVQSYSNASWSGNVIFANNTCGRRGGAIFVRNHANVAWNGPTCLSNNTAAGKGGAVMVSLISSVSWEAEMAFVQNFASQNEGGGLYVGDHSSLSWSGETQFVGNMAGTSGGAMTVALNSDAFGYGNVSYVSNSAAEAGGAVLVSDDSNISWSGDAMFASNTAGIGGALLVDSSRAFWNGTTAFLNNSAREGAGGAINVRKLSTASSTSEITFTRNSGAAGGAVSVDAVSIVYFDGGTNFDGNVARSNYGGAVSVSSSSVYWRNRTVFTRNTAVTYGGAISVFAEISASDSSSSLVFAGPTVFTKNACKANGGALSLIGGVVMTIDTINISFVGNRAEIGGGAIYMWGNDYGPEFMGVSFISNYAQHGGGVFSTGSGNALISFDGEQQSHPVVYDRCRFVENQAVATGGAIQSASGQDEVANTVFLRNMAAEGGSLNLAGTALLENCSFMENASEEGGGPVVSNIGYISGIFNSSFFGNAYSCEPNSFLDSVSSNDLFGVICKGCDQICDGCYFERSSETPFCAETMKNSYSPGGLTTLDLVTIDPGYWRATASSEEVLVCYNADACLGGLTGALDFCLDGYEGPYCAICSDGYSASLGFTCNRCSNSPGGIALAVISALAILAVMVSFASYLLSAELERGAARAFAERLLRHIPVQSMKVVIIVWQIVTQFVSVANVQYPYVYQRFLDGVKLLEFDLGWMLSASCVININFHGRLLFATVGPIVVIVLLGLTYTIALRRNRRSRRAIENVKHRHLSAALLLTFLVYANVSSILFQTFSCEYLDNGKYYLRADYRIECDSAKHEILQVYAGIMIVLYTVGIPYFYAILLFKNRDVLVQASPFRNNSSRVRSTSSLWSPYKPSVFYFEVIECARRVLLAGVVVFFNPGTASQIAVALILAFAFAIVSESLDPYTSKWDTWLSRTGHVVVFVSVYVALLLKVDVSTERNDSQQAFEVILVLFNACMIATVVIETTVMACSLECLPSRIREDDTTPDTYPRFRSMKWLVSRDVSLWQEELEEET